MHPALKDLLILQDRDVRRVRLENELKRIPLERKAVENGLAQQTAAFEEHQLQARQIESSRKTIELQVASMNESIAKYRNQQMATRKNDEYQALGHEIERFKREVRALEDQELVLMERYEEALKGVEQERAVVAEAKATAKIQLEQLEAKQRALMQQLEEVQASQAEWEQKVEPRYLKQYRRILASKGDVAIVPIEGDDSCGGCHMKLIRATVIDAKKGQEIVTCPNCGRIVFWPEG